MDFFGPMQRNATWLAYIANHTVIPAKAGTYAAWVPAFAGMTILCGVCYIMPNFFTMCATVFAPRGGIDDAGFRGYLQRQIDAKLRRSSPATSSPSPPASTPPSSSRVP